MHQDDLLKDVVFDQVKMDESSATTYGKLLCCWTGAEIL